MGLLDEFEQNPVWAAHLAAVEDSAAGSLRMQVLMQEMAMEAARIERKRQRYRQAKVRGYSPARRA